jgi:hypothetical protein
MATNRLARRLITLEQERAELVSLLEEYVDWHCRFGEPFAGICVCELCRKARDLLARDVEKSS